MLGEIGRGRTLVRYDPRGMGLSDRGVHDLSLERQVEDLQAVVEAMGLSRFALMGFLPEMGPSPSTTRSGIPSV